MFSRRSGRPQADEEFVEAIAPGTRGAYSLVKIGAILVFGIFISAGGLAAFGFSGGDDEHRPVLKQAGPALMLGGDGVELLKKMGGADCTATEGSGERWVFRIRESGDQAESEACQPMDGDLVVRVEGRTIVSFVPVHGESQAVTDAAGFEQYQRRYSGAPPKKRKPRR